VVSLHVDSTMMAMEVQGALVNAQRPVARLDSWRPINGRRGHRNRSCGRLEKPTLLDCALRRRN
jgi:hypothetical protein